MMTRLRFVLRRSVAASSLALAMFGASAAIAAESPMRWVEGRHYSLIQPAQPQSVPAGKVEVVEVFSYGCPACFSFQPVMDKLKAALPANAQIVYVPASWNPSESWPLFQRAYLTAQALGIAEKTHSAMFSAIWGPNGELAVADMTTQRLKAKQPTIEDVARFYAKRAGIKEADFIATAKSFAVNLKVKQADQLVKSYGALSTPTLVVAGKYRINSQALGDTSEIIELTRWLAQREVT